MGQSAICNNESMTKLYVCIHAISRLASKNKGNHQCHPSFLLDKAQITSSHIFSAMSNEYSNYATILAM
jgi:hypothetical protein